MILIISSPNKVPLIILIFGNSPFKFRPLLEALNLRLARSLSERSWEVLDLWGDGSASEAEFMFRAVKGLGFRV